MLKRAPSGNPQCESSSRPISFRHDARDGMLRPWIKIHPAERGLVSASLEYPDLAVPAEVERLVRTFYDRVQADDLLGPVFVDQARVDWDEHIPKLTAFWCAIGLGIPGFKGSPTQKHSILSREKPFKAAQFERWVSLFHDTIDQGWAGPVAEKIKERAVAIAKLQSRLVFGSEPWGVTETGPIETGPPETGAS